MVPSSCERLPNCQSYILQSDSPIYWGWAIPPGSKIGTCVPSGTGKGQTCSGQRRIAREGTCHGHLISCQSATIASARLGVGGTTLKFEDEDRRFESLRFGEDLPNPRSQLGTAKDHLILLTHIQLLTLRNNRVLGRAWLVSGSCSVSGTGFRFEIGYQTVSRGSLLMSYTEVCVRTRRYEVAKGIKRIDSGWG